MPTYRAPGLHPLKPRLPPAPAARPGTAIAGLLGPTCRGPLYGPPVALSSFVEFEQRYGDAGDLTLDGHGVPNYTALAAQAYFRNGGERLYVVRTVAGVARPGASPAAAMGAPTAADYTGHAGRTGGSSGLAALAEVAEVTLVLAPAAAAGEATEHREVITAIARHCRELRHRIGLVDPREADSLAAVRALAGSLDDSRLALYCPWVVAADPTGRRNALHLPPSGFIAGIYARNDRLRGVHKAPAGLVVNGALGFTRRIDSADQALLNPMGVNCLRHFPRRGHLVWGARTLSRDPQWRYVNVRRYLSYLERSLEAALDWTAAVPNGEPLWASVLVAVDGVLQAEWRLGHLQGATPREAYFVRCDRSTMTAADIDQGRLICELGVAALRPAEFVLLRLELAASRA